MIRYHVKANKKSRNTLRYFGLFLLLFGVFVLFLFFSGLSEPHVFWTIIGTLIAIYGGYLFIHTFEKDKYDIDYEFSEDSMTVKHYRGETVYNYSELDDVSLIVPENENTYSLILIKTGRQKFLIPFTYKKDACDQIYKLLTEKVTIRDLTDEIEKAKKAAGVVVDHTDADKDSAEDSDKEVNVE